MANLNMQLHGDLVSLMEECTEGFEIVRNTKTGVGLDAWRRLNHKYDPRNPLRNMMVLEKLLAPPQVGCADVVASMQKLRRSIHTVCIQKICPKILGDHLAVQASSIDSPEKQRLTIEKFLQANAHGAGATHTDVDALSKTMGGKKGGKKKDKEPEAKKFDGNCFWCGAHGHAVKDCRKKAAGKPKTAQSPRTPEPNAKGKGKGGPGKKGASSLDEWPDGQEEHPLVRNQARKLRACSWAPLTDVKGATSENLTDAKGTTGVTGKPGNGSRNRLSNSGNPTELEIWARILLTPRWEREST